MTTTATNKTVKTAPKNNWDELQELLKTAREITELENARMQERRKNAGLEPVQEFKFIPAFTKPLLTREYVIIRVPAETAKHLKKVERHFIVSFSNFAKKIMNKIKVPGHYRHGDFPTKNGDTTTPRVWRHFFIDPTCLGKEIVAEVTISQKVNLISGINDILVDIVQLKSDGPIEATHTFRMGVDSTGDPDEIKIPGSDKVIRIEEIRPRMIKMIA